MSWWLTAFRGAVALALGLAVLFVSRGESFLATSLGLYFALSGIAALHSAAAEPARGRARLRRGAGIVAILLAVAILCRELVVQAGPDWIVPVVLGVGSIAVGTMRLAGGFAEGDEDAAPMPARRRLPAGEIALGISELVLGGALLTTDVDWIWPAVALWGIVGGAAILGDARRRRYAARGHRQASRA